MHDGFDSTDDVRDSQSRTAFVFDVKILSRALARDKVRIRECVNGSDVKDEKALKARVIHVDFKEHNTNQIGCGLSRSHLILVSNVSTGAGNSILDFSSLQQPAHPHSSSAQHSRREARHYVERLSHYESVCYGIALSDMRRQPMIF